MRKINRGIIQVYTGDGKGKTTAALGQTIRALGWGKSVCWIQFIKGNSNIGEIKFFKSLPKKLRQKLIFKQFHRTREYAIGKPQNVHKSACRKAFQYLGKILKQNSFDMIVLDELNNAIEYNLVSLEEVIELLKSKPATLQLIVTGRDAHKELVNVADLVTEMTKIKHPFDKGYEAVKGIEY